MRIKQYFTKLLSSGLIILGITIAACLSVTSCSPENSKYFYGQGGINYIPSKKLAGAISHSSIEVIKKELHKELVRECYEKTKDAKILTQDLRTYVELLSSRCTLLKHVEMKLVRNNVEELIHYTDIRTILFPSDRGKAMYLIECDYIDHVDEANTRPTITTFGSIDVLKIKPKKKSYNNDSAFKLTPMGCSLVAIAQSAQLYKDKNDQCK